MVEVVVVVMRDCGVLGLSLFLCCDGCWVINILTSEGKEEEGTEGEKGGRRERKVE